jgi:hypothetical protein
VGDAGLASYGSGMSVAMGLESKLGVRTGLGSSLVLQLELGRWSTRPTQRKFQLVLFDAEHLRPYHRVTHMSREVGYNERLGAFHRKAYQFTVASSASSGRNVQELSKSIVSCSNATISDGQIFNSYARHHRS